MLPLLFWLSLSFATARPRTGASTSLLKGTVMTTWTFAGPFGGPWFLEREALAPIVLGASLWAMWCFVTVRMRWTRGQLIASASGFLIWTAIGFVAVVVAGLRAT